MSKKEEIIYKFKLRLENGQSIKYNDLKREDSSLLYAIERHFGGILKLALHIGISEEQLINEYGLTRNINRKTLSEEEIKSRLLYLKSIGKLTTNAMRNEFNDLRLEQSIKKTYGSVENGLKHFNLERDLVRYSKKSLINKINELSINNFDLSYSNMLKTNPKLLYAVNNLFKKGWYDALDEIGVEYSAIRKSFSKESILNRLNKLMNMFGEVNYKIIKEYDSSILFYAYDNYQSLVDFYIDMGINPNECMDFSKQTNKGFAFEKVFKEILELLGVEFKYNKYFDEDTRPDFQLNNNVWIDCKLSSWTESIESTIEKYTPKCEKLIIVFLRGDIFHTSKYNIPNVEFRKIDYYFPFLEQINRHDLIEKLENILKNEFLESVTTERLVS